MDTGDLSRRIVVRYREPGYLRFELPAAICHEAALAALDAALRGVTGVYRVSAYAADCRLVVWYNRYVCQAADVARALKAVLPVMPPAPPGAAESVAEPVATAERSPAAATTDAVRARLQPLLSGALSERAVTNFLNDVLAFYLIRVHWELITKRWLQEPLKHANAWLTVFYLVFLLVRYRKSINQPAPVPASEPVP